MLCSLPQVPLRAVSPILRYCLVLLLLSSEPAFAEYPAAPDGQSDFLPTIARLELQDLLTQEVTSVLRKEQTLSTAPAAIFVLTAEDIRRSGATNIPDLLRIVPGVTVVRNNANSWSITARGFDTNGSAKLLVLIDGRSVYTPLFSGVFWDVQDVIFDDIERIEVIRGPGAVSWGENAVNGVINIITKRAKDTQGWFFEGGGGKEEQGFGSLQYGGQAGEDTSYRVFGKFFKRDSFTEANGENAQDGWDMARGGFRLDSKLSKRDDVSVQGALYNGDSAARVDRFESFAPPFTRLLKDDTDLGGGHLMATYNHTFSADSELTVRSYYDRTERFTQSAGEERDTWDLDVQHHLRASETHDLVYGGDIRFSNDEIRNGTDLQFDPTTQTDHLFTLFVQDQITIVPERFSLIPGIKLGYNSYSHMEYQPALKAVWTPGRDKTLWGSVSRAVRIPARLDQDVIAYGNGAVLPDGTPAVLQVLGSKDFEGEDLMAYEIGFRAEPVSSFSYDIATFFHRYRDLLSAEMLPPALVTDPGPPHLVSPLLINNEAHGDTFGAETAVSWKPADTVALTATYSFTKVNLAPNAGQSDIGSQTTERRTPVNQAGLRAHINLPWNLELDPALYYVDSTPGNDTDSYIRADARLGWLMHKNASVEFVVQDLFDNAHTESASGRNVGIERAYFGRVKLKF